MNFTLTMITDTIFTMMIVIIVVSVQMCIFSFSQTQHLRLFA